MACAPGGQALLAVSRLGHIESLKSDMGKRHFLTARVCLARFCANTAAHYRADIQRERPGRHWLVPVAALVGVAAFPLLHAHARTIAIGQLTALRIEDYATMPISGSTVFPSATANSAYLARPNFLAEEPGGGNRFFVNDLNGPLYMFDRTTKQFTTYLNFNGRGSATGLFDKFVFSSGFANGLITFQFDPDYRNNGKFYTVHMEEPGAAGSQIPNNATVPGFNTAGYTATPAVTTPSGAPGRRF